MSNPNFVSDLVAMAKAFEELPQVKAELEDAKHHFSEASQRIIEREESILKLKAELEASHEARRKVEAERDDAELRFLEADERTSRALDFIKTTFGSAGSVIQSLEPPAPVAVPTPPAEPEVKHEALWDTVRKTFEVPEGYQAVYDADGRATGEVVKVVKVGASEGNLLRTIHEYDTDAAQPTGQGAADPTATMQSSEVIPQTGPVSQSASGTIADGPVDAATEPVSVPSSPTPAPVAQTGTGTEPEASSSEDVGYHNEPSRYTDGWYDWARKMDRKHNLGWPDRPTA